MFSFTSPLVHCLPFFLLWLVSDTSTTLRISLVPLYQWFLNVHFFPRGSLVTWFSIRTYFQLQITELYKSTFLDFSIINNGMPTSPRNHYSSKLSSWLLLHSRWLVSAKFSFFTASSQSHSFLWLSLAPCVRWNYAATKLWHSPNSFTYDSFLNLRHLNATVVVFSDITLAMLLCPLNGYLREDLSSLQSKLGILF